jgi:hypothetical protein
MIASLACLTGQIMCIKVILNRIEYVPSLLWRGGWWFMPAQPVGDTMDVNVDADADTPK